MQNIQNETYPFKLPPLPYEYDALEPYIDAETMHYHHDKHFQSYVSNLNKALKGQPKLHDFTLEQLLTRTRFLSDDLQTKIQQNGGGVYNHNFFFDNLIPASMGGNKPHGNLLEDINSFFGSFETFKESFSTQAMEVFGSGWVCLAYTRQGKLRIFTLHNQETVLEMNAAPVLLLDVWEHAYYLKYRNLRADYIEAVWNVLSFI